jgi:hypothetical protein
MASGKNSMASLSADEPKAETCAFSAKSQMAASGALSPAVRKVTVVKYDMAIADMSKSNCPLPNCITLSNLTTNKCLEIYDYRRGRLRTEAAMAARRSTYSHTPCYYFAPRDNVVTVCITVLLGLTLHAAITASPFCFSATRSSLVLLCNP